MKVYLIHPESKEVQRFICHINTYYEVLDAVIEAYQDGNYDMYDETLGWYLCHRDSGEIFYLNVVED